MLHFLNRYIDPKCSYQLVKSTSCQLLENFDLQKVALKLVDFDQGLTTGSTIHLLARLRSMPPVLP